MQNWSPNEAIQSLFQVGTLSRQLMFHKKILAKVLAIRIKHTLPQIVMTKQTSFIQGKYILDNIVANGKTHNGSKP